MTFDEIITPEEQVEILEAVRDFAFKLYIARIVILMLHELLDERFKDPIGFYGI